MVPFGMLTPRLLPLLLPLAGCAGLSSARPLPQGQHEVGITLGGGFLEFGGAAIPLPNAILEGRSGVATLAERPLSLNYALNLTGLPFGVFQGHVGAAFLIIDQQGAAPALAITDRVHFASNFLGVGNRATGRLAGFATNQIELDASWLIKGQLLYLGLAQYTDFAAPKFNLTPVLGATFDPGPAGGVRIQLETRWYGVSTNNPYNNVQWLGGPQGAFGASLGISYLLGAR